MLSVIFFSSRFTGILRKTKTSAVPPPSVKLECIARVPSRFQSLLFLYHRKARHLKLQKLFSDYKIWGKEVGNETLWLSQNLIEDNNCNSIGVHNQKGSNCVKGRSKFGTRRNSTLKTADAHLQTLPLIQMMPNKEEPYRVLIIYRQKLDIFKNISVNLWARLVLNPAVKAQTKQCSA